MRERPRARFGRRLQNQLLPFVAEAPQFNAGFEPRRPRRRSLTGGGGYASVREYDTPAGATCERAAFGHGPAPRAPARGRIKRTQAVSTYLRCHQVRSHIYELGFVQLLLVSFLEWVALHSYCYYY